MSYESKFKSEVNADDQLVFSFSTIYNEHEICVSLLIFWIFKKNNKITEIMWLYALYILLTYFLNYKRFDRIQR